MELEKKKAEFSLVKTGSLYALQVHSEGFILISDYKLQSSADGETELCVTFKGTANEFELKADLMQ